MHFWRPVHWRPVSRMPMPVRRTNNRSSANRVRSIRRVGHIRVSLPCLRKMPMCRPCSPSRALRSDLLAVPEWTVETVAEQNWVQLTQSQFDPIRVSQRLWIVPSWHESPDPAAVNLVLDPGMAFGTGSHPTTRLCLEWLERNVSGACSVLDYGCGSGILAIAAARLGRRASRRCRHRPAGG